MQKNEILKKEVMEKDVLHRITWDPQLDPAEFMILYVDRSRTELAEVNFSDVKLEGDFLRLDESLIPLHRIRKILWDEEIIWEKRRI